jgi:hypothetical protein
MVSHGQPTGQRKNEEQAGQRRIHREGEETKLGGVTDGAVLVAEVLPGVAVAALAGERSRLMLPDMTDAVEHMFDGRDR